MQHLSIVLSGFAFFGCLIVSIGAQNAFVLRQGLAGIRVSTVVGICIGSDFILGAAGIAGVGTLIQRQPTILLVSTLAGVAFLTTYGVFAIRRAMMAETLIANDHAVRNSALATVGTCFAVTWLNPHVYLDNLVLLGSVANAHPDARWWFGVGAATASALWFALLGFGARWLRPVFAKPNTWRIFEAAIAVIMFVIAGRLLTTL